jgi:ATP/maltotriose-dependent transcriptional regulator MalT
VGRGFLSVNSFSRFHLLRAQALARTGDPNAAAHAIEAAAALRHPAYRYYDSLELLAQAWLAATAGRCVDARDLVLSAAEFARQHQQFAREVWCLQTAVQFGDADAVGRLTELAAQLKTPRATVAAAYADALSADEAAGLDTVSKQLESMGDRLAAADAAAQSVASHRRAGRTDAASTATARARRLAAACGGAMSPAITGLDVAVPLTEREREIVALVARGLTNRQIAQMMHLSVRTVESHVYRASSKTGVVGRAGLRNRIG